MFTNPQNPDSKEFKIRPRRDLDSSNDKDLSRVPKKFESKEAYVRWLEIELDKLETRFSGFATVGSNRNYLGR